MHKSFKVLADGASNGLRFAERWEAEWYLSDLSGRWFGARDFAVAESADDVCSHVDACLAQGTGRGWYARGHYLSAHDLQHVPPPADRDESRARAVVAALVAARPIMERAIEAREEATELARDPSPAFVEPIRMEVAVGLLPSHVRDAITCYGYALATIPVEVCHDTIRVSASANDGCQAIVTTAVVTYPEGFPLPTWKIIRETGPWGGPNAFQKSSIELTPTRKIPDGGCIVTGTTRNRHRSSPYLVLHARAVDFALWIAGDSADFPESVVLRDLVEIGPSKRREAWGLAYQICGEIARRLTSPAGELDERSTRVLLVFRTYKSASRRPELDRQGLNAADVDRCVEAGYLKRASNGATSLTPTGKSAIAGIRTFGVL